MKGRAAPLLPDLGQKLHPSDSTPWTILLRLTLITLLDPEGQLPALEEEILSAPAPETGQKMLGSGAKPVGPVQRRLSDSLRQLTSATAVSVPPVLLCPSPARYHVKRWLEPVLPRLAVVSAAEIPAEIRLRPVGTVR